jgi:hypothetical protein
MPARYVTWDRWDAEHKALREHEDSAIAGVEDRLADRIGDVEARCTTLEQSRTLRANRGWMLSMAFLTGLVLPLVVVAIVAWAQSRG